MCDTVLTCSARCCTLRSGGSLANVRRTFGAAELALQPGVVPALAELVHIAPNGVMFAPPATRPGVLPRLLSEVSMARASAHCVLVCNAH